MLATLIRDSLAYQLLVKSALQNDAVHALIFLVIAIIAQ
jgi:hypothetical protein